MGVICLCMYVCMYVCGVIVWGGGEEGDEVGLICLVTCMYVLH